MSQTQNQNIGTSTLQPDYLLTSDNIMQLQTFATMLQMQVVLDLPVDEGLAMQVKIFQNQMNVKAEYIQNQFLTDFIGLLSESSNFYYLWNAALENEPELIESAVTNSVARTSSSQVMSELANQSGRLNQKAKIVAANLAVIKSELDETNTSFDTVLQTAINALGDSASTFSTTIDTLQKTIQKNIDDIVDGANKTGTATSELIIGILTTIKDASPDKPKEESKDKPKDESKKLSTDFAVKSIQGAKEGTEETSQARADLNANNEKIATAFQGLANANALIAVAKAVKVQNDMFTKSVHDTLNSIQKISETWGNTPVLPPASGISLNFLNFSEAIDGILGQEDADKLIAIMDYVGTEWDVFNNQLKYFKKKLTCIPQSQYINKQRMYLN